MAEELVGPSSLKVANYPFCKMIYPTGETDWQLPDRGHMDGYTRPIIIKIIGLRARVDIGVLSQ